MASIFGEYLCCGKLVEVEKMYSKIEWKVLVDEGVRLARREAGN
jgi:hypothetical protein